MHRCPNRACPSRGLETLINWVQAAGRHRGRRRGDDAAAVGGGARSLAAGSLPADEGAVAASSTASARSPRTNAIAGDRSSRRSGAVLARPARPEHPATSAGSPRETSRATSGASTGCSRRRRRTSAGRGHRPRPRRGDRRVVRGRAEPRARSTSCARSECDFEASDEERPKEGPLTGNTYVITGTLESMSREQAAAALEELGAKITNAVSAKTTALIVGEEPGNSKLTKAQKVGTTILNEQELWNCSTRVGAAQPRRSNARRSSAPPNAARGVDAPKARPARASDQIRAELARLSRSGPVLRAHTSTRAGGRSG